MKKSILLITIFTIFLTVTVSAELPTGISNNGVEITKIELNINSSDMSKFKLSGSDDIMNFDPSEDEGKTSGSLYNGKFSWTIDENDTVTITGNGALEESERGSLDASGNVRVLSIKQLLPGSIHARAKKIIFSEGITTLGMYSMSNMPVLEEIYFPSTMRLLRAYSFMKCPNLKTIHSDSYDLTIYSSCFGECDNIEDFNKLFQHVKTIEGNPYSGCSNFKKLIIPSNVKRIKKFYPAPETISEIIIEDNTSLRVDSKAFSLIPKLSYIYIGRGVAFGEGFCVDCSSLTDVEYADKSSLIFDKEGVSAEDYLFPGSLLSGKRKERYDIYLKHYLRNRIDSQYLDICKSTHLISPETIELAKRITAGIASDYDKAKAIHDYVCENMWYDWPTYKKVEVADPEPANGRLKGVCANYAAWTRQLLISVGIPAQIITGKANGDGGWENHAWNEAYIDGRWIIIDNTWDSQNDYSLQGKYSPVRQALYTYFDMPINIFSQSHIPEPYDSSIDLDEFIKNSANIIVNGKPVASHAFMFENNNYFRIRDVAYLLSGTEKQFEVSFDPERDAVVLKSHTPYTAVGGELTYKEKEKVLTGTPMDYIKKHEFVYKSGSKIIKDNHSIHFDVTGYTIRDNNYFKLRDIGKIFNFYVGYDSGTNSIIIDTTQSYQK